MLGLYLGDELFDQMAEAYAALGWSKMMECDGAGADQAFRRAIELGDHDDQLITARQWYASLLGCLGNYEKNIFSTFCIDQYVNSIKLESWAIHE